MAIWAVVSEAVLRRSIANAEGMQQQLRHLVTVASQPNVSVRILPLAAGPTLASETGAFTVLEFPGRERAAGDWPTTVYSESLTGALYLEKSGEIRAYEEVWSALVRLALDGGESKELINMIAGER
ncbi:DUF5753 domain-containing protein [Plantactinospora sp. KLBMP9567]|uniref:DUF5753 domain-containing protein n=1 Tax=Plantactinospora sp. KLBMP9567 TaxID=3085900 RepID=UPI002980B831|nr:DUF5753 domain-containing protein [Plantactinospora sp. KLBMP9567]MDW5323806.1 DUF5753 domain-containing protein [Plantactinospora sp. KLBMP9567]